MNVLTKAKQSYFVLMATVLFSACGTVYVNPSDRDLRSAERLSVSVERSVDSAYRELSARLQHCLAVYGYRVRGSISRERDIADVTVDSGFGFERTLYLADSLFLKAELERLAPERTRVTFIAPNQGALPFADAARNWLATGEGPCRT